MQSYANRKKIKVAISLLSAAERRVPLGRFLNEESAVRRVTFNMILKNLKIFKKF